ncbi:MAG: hypothetical protein ACRC2R_13455, partial [Xenococcaceae cyanobacterium]
CDAQEISITKTGDRAVAEPGDTVLYRLAIKNLASADLNNLSVTDVLPQGFQFQEKSLRAESDRNPVNITSTIEGSIVTFTPEISLTKDKVLNIVYAAQLTPDAIRGSGKNSAIVNAQRNDNQFSIKDGPAVYSLDIRTGIVSDCGTIIGRVFEDKNFDGHQQPEEPGIPNAVIFLEDGNRIATDEDGLFSLANVLPGYHTGILDLTSIPDYQIAPNRKFSEGNSKTRMVHLEPNGMVRLNFAVTPLEGRGQEAEGRGQEAEGRGQEAEGRGQEAEGRRQEAEGRGQEAEGRGQEAEGRGQEAEGRGQEAEAKKDENLPNSALPEGDGISDLPQQSHRDSSNINRSEER